VGGIDSGAATMKLIALDFISKRRSALPPRERRARRSPSCATAGRSLPARPRARLANYAGSLPQSCRAIIMFLISAIAFAGFRPLGQALAQFMIVWQR
jgi:hypothetical protein